MQARPEGMQALRCAPGRRGRRHCPLVPTCMCGGRWSGWWLASRPAVPRSTSGVCAARPPGCCDALQTAWHCSGQRGSGVAWAAQWRRRRGRHRQQPSSVLRAVFAAAVCPSLIACALLPSSCFPPRSSSSALCGTRVQAAARPAQRQQQPFVVTAKFSRIGKSEWAAEGAADVWQRQAGLLAAAGSSASAGVGDVLAGAVRSFVHDRCLHLTTLHPTCRPGAGAGQGDCGHPGADGQGQGAQQGSGRM